jgi:hypothetical protein
MSDRRRNEGDTFEKVDCKASFVNGAIRDELEPEATGCALDIIGLLIATIAPDEGAALTVTITHFQVVIGTAVMALDLGVRGSVSGRSSGCQGPSPLESAENGAVPEDTRDIQGSDQYLWLPQRTGT